MYYCIYSVFQARLHVLVASPSFKHTHFVLLHPCSISAWNWEASITGQVMSSSPRGFRFFPNKLPKIPRDGETVMFTPYIWVNYNISLTWIKAILGYFPLLTMIPVRSQWGRYNLPRYILHIFQVSSPSFRGFPIAGETRKIVAWLIFILDHRGSHMELTVTLW